MRVAQVVMTRQYRGAEIFAWQLSRELGAQGVDVLYISLYRNTSGKKLITKGINFLDLDSIKTKGFSFQLVKQLATALRDFNPDVVQANAGDTLKYTVMAKLMFRLKYKLVFRNASTVSQYIRSGVQKSFNSFLYHRVNSIVSVSESTQSDLIKTFPFCKAKISVVRNGINFDPIRHVGFPDKSGINLLHIGGFTFEKNHLGLLRIFLEIVRVLPQARLILVGEGPLKKDVEASATELGIIHAITFTGAKENVLDYLSNATMLLLPSIIEGLPAVILESFYCKTPVVAYNVGGISEVIKQGETGWLVNAGDQAGFVTAVHDVLNKKEDDLRTVLENAYNKVVAEFDNRVIAKKFLEVYGKLVASS